MLNLFTHFIFPIIVLSVFVIIPTVVKFHSMNMIRTTIVMTSFDCRYRFRLIKNKKKSHFDSFGFLIDFFYNIKHDNIMKVY